ncbi:hypothetical protein C0993_011819 [Termitomyces sp. T159_Od127]|nr:hypothetical protein C0993_011819 [Termitomyces sp. T159_Od127]
MLIFEKMLTVASKKGTRFVALNRRDYPGSTAYRPEELHIVVSDVTDEEKHAEFQARGIEIATFIDNFIKKNNLPPISKDQKAGGIILLGWSLGSATALSTIANARALPSDTVARLDPAPIVLGLPTPRESWVPLVGDHLPQGLRLAAFGQWVAGYFDHGDLAKRDLSALSWVLPSTNRVPTIFNIPTEKLAEAARYGDDGSNDLLYMMHFVNQFKAAYKRVVHDTETQRLFPSLEQVLLVGERSGAFAIAGMWAAEDDQKESGGHQNLKINLVPGINHFVRRLSCCFACFSTFNSGIGTIPRVH